MADTTVAATFTAEGVTTLSTGVGGAPADGTSEAPVVSADGRYVAYATLAQNLAPECANGLQQIVRTDMHTTATGCVSQGAAAPAGRCAPDRSPKSPAEPLLPDEGVDLSESLDILNLPKPAGLVALSRSSGA